MNRQVLIITSSISPQDRDLIQERLADLEPESVMESEIARRLRDMIDTGAVQVADRANLTDTDVRKIEIMVDAGQRGLIVVEPGGPAPDGVVPAKTLRRRERQRAKAQAAAEARRAELAFYVNKATFGPAYKKGQVRAELREGPCLTFLREDGSWYALEIRRSHNLLGNGDASLYIAYDTQPEKVKAAIRELFPDYDFEATS